MNLVKGKSNQTCSISTYGLKSMLQRQVDERYPSKGISWTDDFRCELPIRLTSEGLGSIQPITIIEMFQRAVQLYGEQPALSVKRNGKWVTINYKEYYKQCIIFAKALIAVGCPEFTSVNIIGFNSPQWNISFFGSIFARSIPTGIYTTNSVETCQFIAQNSECRVLIAQNMEYVKKYIRLIQNGSIKKVIIYNDSDYKVQPKYDQIIFKWNQFMAEGNRVQDKNLQERMMKVKPGSCCTLVYTSGTTGMPKGVMLSHDNYTWTKKSLNAYHDRSNDTGGLKLVSFLPLSHVAGQFSDIISPLDEGIHVYFAQPSALQGTLIQTLLQVRPTVFLSVPRVWQKIYDKMQQIAKSNGALKSYIATWAKSIGPQGTMQQVRNQQTSFAFKVAKTLVFNNVKKALGLDQCKFFLYGAAPLDPKIRAYFLSLNFFLINTYGMSQSTGPQNFSDKDTFDHTDMNCYKQVGKSIPGTQIKIVQLDPKDDDGQICYRGRNIFMGYYKMAEQTSKTIDSEGFLHSGDMGKLDKNGVLYITGRAKQLIITAGGQNIPPVLIQQQIFANLPFINNVMVIGDNKKYLACLISLKQSAPGSGLLQQSAKSYFSTRGQELKTIQQARKSKLVKNCIIEGLKKANQKAISRAQVVQDFFIMKQEFSVENGLLTPTLKLKRKQALKRFASEIQQMYTKPNL